MDEYHAKLCTVLILINNSNSQYFKYFNVQKYYFTTDMPGYNN